VRSEPFSVAGQAMLQAYKSAAAVYVDSAASAIAGVALSLVSGQAEELVELIICSDCGSVARSASVLRPAKY